MKKVYIVMDEPKSCAECPLFRGSYADMICGGNGYGINYPYPKDFKQEWCPLKSMPEEMGFHDIFSSVEYAKGWNACIDRILEGGD